MQTTFKNFFKELVFIDWYRKLRGTKLDKSKTNKEDTKDTNSTTSNDEKTSSFNDR